MIFVIFCFLKLDNICYEFLFYLEILPGDIKRLKHPIYDENHILFDAFLLVLLSKITLTIIKCPLTKL